METWLQWRTIAGDKYLI